MKDLFKFVSDAIEYALQEIDSYRIDYLVAEMDRCHCPARMINNDSEELIEKMNEWAEDNNLPEYFWEEKYDDDDIVYCAYDIIHENE